MPFRRSSGAPGPRFAADWLVVGLGNPGEEYARTRHNVGFWVVNRLAKRAGTQPKSVGSLMQIGVGTLQGQRVALVRPKTYMNASGRAVAQALQWTGCTLARTIVVYDELDLAVGQIRVRAGGGHGGHNGLKSIAQHAGLDFIRVRIGIGRPTVNGEPSWDPDIVADWVLSPPSPADRELLEAAADRAADAVETIIASGVDAAAAAFNRKV